jgi:hypothetical protein
LLVFFRATVKLATHFELIGGAFVAVTAPNLEPKPKKTILIPTKCHIAYIDARLDEYNATLAKEDGDVQKQSIAKKKKTYSIQKQKILGIKIQLILLFQISTSDPDSRQIMTRNNISKWPTQYKLP